MDKHWKFHKVLHPRGRLFWQKEESQRMGHRNAAHGLLSCVPHSWKASDLMSSRWNMNAWRRSGGDTHAVCLSICRTSTGSKNIYRPSHISFDELQAFTTHCPPQFVVVPLHAYKRHASFSERIQQHYLIWEAAYVTANRDRQLFMAFHTSESKFVSMQQ